MAQFLGGETPRAHVQSEASLLAIGMPVSLTLLAVTWLVLAQVTPSTGSASIRLGGGATTLEISKGQKRVAMMAGLAALAWMTRPAIDAVRPAVGLSHAGIAVVAAV